MLAGGLDTFDWLKDRNKRPSVVIDLSGVEALREVVKSCRQLGVEYLTVFAFSSENWRRPADEVSFLMSLFLKMLGPASEIAPSSSGRRMP